MEDKLRCRRCFKWKLPIEFYDKTTEIHKKRKICKECEIALNKYRNHQNRHKPHVTHRVNLSDRMDTIARLDSLAQQFLSANDRNNLLNLAREMKAFGLVHRAQELELAAQ